MNIKTITNTILLATTLTNFAYAAIPGPYLGVGAGYNTMRDFSNAHTTDAGGIGGTLFAGFNFNEYIGLEASYRHYTQTNFQFDNSNYNFDCSMHSFNIVAKGYLPFGADNKFNFYGFIGASGVYVSTDLNYQSYYYNASQLDSDSNSAVLLTAGIGMDYAITQSVTLGAELAGTQAQAGDNHHIGIPGTNMFNAMLAYHFN